MPIPISETKSTNLAQDPFIEFARFGINEKSCGYIENYQKDNPQYQYSLENNRVKDNQRGFSSFISKTLLHED